MKNISELSNEEFERISNMTEDQKEKRIAYLYNQISIGEKLLVSGSYNSDEHKNTVEKMLKDKIYGYELEIAKLTFGHIAGLRFKISE
jgi:hypothetical protein